MARSKYKNNDNNCNNTCFVFKERKKVAAIATIILILNSGRNRNDNVELSLA